MQQRVFTGIVGFAFVLGCCVSLFVLIDCQVQKRASRVYVYLAPDGVGELLDDVAVEVASAIMEAEGYDLLEWSPLRDGRTASPSGVPDEYFARNSQVPNIGYVHFAHSGGYAWRMVFLEMTGGTISGYVWMPK